MKHYAYQPAGQPVELRADYVVVGTGAAGSSVAVGLARLGADVIMVEAGPWRDPKDYPTSVYGAMRDMFDEFGVGVAVGRSAMPIVQARVVGGTTVINSAIVVRTPGDVFRQWERDHGCGNDRFAEAVWRAQDIVEKDLWVSKVPRTTWGKTNALADRGAKALGFHDHDMMRNVRDCAGHGQCMQGCTAGHKQSTNLNYVPETLRLGGRILSCAPVRRILFDKRRAVGVSGRFVHPTTKARGARFEVRANKAVIVACSATRSPVLLANSGVKSKALGKYFRAHPGTGIFGVYDDAVDLNSGATQGWASTKFRNSHDIKLETLSIPLELIASRLSGAGHRLMDRLSRYRHLAMWVMAVRAEAVGRVWATPFGKPIVTYSMTPRDMHALRAGAYKVAQMHVAAGAKKIIPGIYGMPYSLEPDQIESIRHAPLTPSSYTTIMSHIFGGCVMGTDPRTSVVDADGWVHGYQGLMVADAAAIPSTLGVNPQHTLMSLALVRAEQIMGGELTVPKNRPRSRKKIQAAG